MNTPERKSRNTGLNIETVKNDDDPRIVLDNDLIRFMLDKETPDDGAQASPGR